MSSPNPPPDRASILRAALIELRTLKAQLRLSEAALQKLSANYPADVSTSFSAGSLPLPSTEAENRRRELARGSTTRAPTERIAIVGAACRLPGGVDSPDAFWKRLAESYDGVIGVPEGRWNHAEYYDPDPDAPGKMYLNSGGFLTDIHHFDPQFFGISPREALTMDPQQRLLLEVTWEALENAGQAPDKLSGSRTGVYLGIFASEYPQLQMVQGTDPTLMDAYAITGNVSSMASGRISFALGLQGPSIAMDTACSSSLVALHLACQSLRAGETDLALVGGVNLMLSPIANVGMCKLRALAPDGRCKSFDVSADGYGRGEGCVVLVCRRLSDALKRRDSIYAVVLGSAVNQDGPSSGLTVPNGPAQQSVIRDALAEAGVSPDHVSHLEAHGTGTPLGDPIEIQAAGAVFGKSRQSRDPLIIGTVKANIGHLEAAAGVASVLKVALSLQHAEVPAHPTLRELNPRLSLRNIPAIIPVERLPFPAIGGRRIAGISSFGFSGTNAHVVLEEAPRPLDRPLSPARPFDLFLISARTEAVVGSLIRRYSDHLRSTDEPFPDRCFTSRVGRSHFSRRIALIVKSSEDLVQKLTTLRSKLEGDSPSYLFDADTAPSPSRLDSLSRVDSEVHSGRITGSMRPKVAWVFSDLRGDPAGMTRELMESWPFFRRFVAQCAEILSASAAFDLNVALAPDDPLATQMKPSLRTSVLGFVLQAGLASLLKSFGFEPSAVFGMKIGEVVAALVAGAITLEQSLDLTLARTRFFDAWTAALHNEGRLAAEAEFHEIFHKLTLSAPRTRWIASWSGEMVKGRGAAQSDVWLRQARQPDQTDAALQSLKSIGVNTLLLIAPVKDELLGSALEVHRVDPSWSVIPTLIQAVSAQKSLMIALARLYCQGVDIQWESLDRDFFPARVPLPTYAFERHRFWFDKPSGPVQPATASVKSAVRAIDFPGERLEHSLPTWQLPLTFERYNWLRDLHVWKISILPPGILLSMVLECLHQCLKVKAVRLQELKFGGPLVLTESPPMLQLVVILTGTHSALFRISSLNVGSSSLDSWQTLLTGSASRGGDPANQLRFEVLEASDPQSSWQSPYAQWVERGLDIGPTLQVVASKDRAGQVGIRLPLDLSSFNFHPLWWDGILQLPQVLIPDPLASSTIDSNLSQIPPGFEEGLERLMEMARRAAAPVYYPDTIDEVDLKPDLRSITALSVKVQQTGPILSLGLEAPSTDSASTCIGTVRGFKVRQFNRHELRQQLSFNIAEWIYALEWQPAPVTQRRPAIEGHWVLIGKPGAFEKQLLNQLNQTGAETSLVDLEPIVYRDQATYLQAFEAALLGHLRAMATSSAIMGVIFCSPLDRPENASINRLELDRAQDCCVHALHRLVLDLIHQPELASARLYVLTRKAQAVALGDSPNLATAPLWGYVRVLALEAPERWGAIVDLDDVATLEGPDAAACVLESILATDGEDQVAWRTSAGKPARQVLRLLPKPSLANHRPPVIHADATYLLTGGLGGLGLEMARWLVLQGARHLVMTGRQERPELASTAQQTIASTPTPSLELSAVRELEGQGATVSYFALDVGDDAAMEDLFATLRQDFPPLRGIFHAAGITVPRPIPALDHETLTKVMVPKVLGSWNLHRLSVDLELDFFVGFSSIAAVWGSAALANYAAANAFLDALAQVRRAEGNPALAINFGPWAEIGMSSSMEEQLLLLRMGTDSLPTAPAVEAVGRLMGSGEAQATLALMDWDVFKVVYQARARRPLLDQLASAVSDSAAPLPRSALMETLQVASDRERVALIEQYLRTTLAKVLRLDFEDVAPDQEFMKLGLDSLMVMELLNDSRKNLQLMLYPREFLEHPTIAALSKYLADQLAQKQLAQNMGSASSVTPTDSEEEMDRVLAEELAGSLPRRVTPFIASARKNARAAFILSSPRSGSTLLRVMLAGHAQLFSPPELHLLGYASLQEREKAMSVSFMGEGLDRALMELDHLSGDGARSTIKAWTDADLLTHEVYRRLQQKAAPRMLIDKSPSYGGSLETLMHAELIFEEPLYIHLIRHPYAMIESFVRNRIDRVLGVSGIDAHLVGEQAWLRPNLNILTFFDSIPADRQLRVVYEALVKDPEATMVQLCDFLRIPFDNELLRPYAEGRMTDGIHHQSLSIGDPNFMQHNRIEAELGDAWKSIQLPRTLGGRTVSLATTLGYQTREALEPQTLASEPKDRSGGAESRGGITELSPNSYLPEDARPGSSLYGLAQAREAILLEDHVIIAESYEMVRKAHQHGIFNVVTGVGSGTGLSLEQLQHLLPLTKMVIGFEPVGFDPRTLIESSSSDAGVLSDHRFRGTYEERRVASREVGAEVAYTLYVPPGTSARSPVPLVIFLQAVERVGSQALSALLDRLIDTGTLHPFAFATASAGRSLYLDRFDGSANWEQFFVHEFVAHLRDVMEARLNYRVGLMGASMGGLGALRIALKYPQRFAAVAAHAPAIDPALTYDQLPEISVLKILRPQAFIETLYGPAPAVFDTWNANNPAWIARQTAATIRASALPIYLDCGTKDSMAYAGTEFLHRLLNELQILHEFQQVPDMRHNRAFFSFAIMQGLHFMSETLTPESRDSSVRLEAPNARDV